MKRQTILAAISITFLGAAWAGAGCSSTTGTTSTGGTGGKTSSSSTSSSTSSSGTTTLSSGTTTSSSGTTTGNPPPPAIGATQIDRMGRPAINTALNHAFDASAAAGTAKDAYNADSAAAGWAAKNAAEFAANLAILDALDNVCGNQFGYKTPTSATSYGTVAGVLADDRLWLDTTGTTCKQYLAVEAKVLGVANTDCGGRGPDYDVIDTSYSTLAIGALTGVGDGVAANDVANSATFPYLAAPH